MPEPRLLRTRLAYLDLLDCVKKTHLWWYVRRTPAEDQVKAFCVHCRKEYISSTADWKLYQQATAVQHAE